MIKKLLACLVFAATFNAGAEVIDCKDLTSYDGRTWQPLNMSLNLISTEGPDWGFTLTLPNSPSLNGLTNPQRFQKQLNQQVISAAQLFYPKEKLNAYEAFVIVDQHDDSTGITFFRLINADRKTYGGFMVIGWSFAKCGSINIDQ